MNLRQAFLDLAENDLTSAQFRVVSELGRGPVKVVAGAGSGKTTTMAYLYAAAVAGGMPVSRIMAVTFTDRAAVELKEKILTALAAARLLPEPAVGDPLEGAWVGTFHQLVRRMLADHAYLAGLPRDLELIDEVVAGMVMEETLTAVRQQAAASPWMRELPPRPHPRTLLGLLDGATATVRGVRSTDLLPGECERESLAAYDSFTARGDPAEEIAWHRAGLRLTTSIWRDYEHRLAERQALDFDGLLREGLLALRRSPALLSWCRTNFQLVIVDEYQDTSALQESLILELTGPQQRSLFMVGDARQSIYAFRDAKPGIMTDANGRAFGLFRNHRSREPILEAADHVIRADPQFADDEAMEAARADDSPLPVWVAVVDDPAREAEAIAEAIDLLHRDGITYPDGSQQNLRWGDLAVLAFTLSRLGQPLEEALRRRSIPFQTVSGGLLARPEVKDVLALLRLAADDRDDLACLRVLQSPVGQIPDQALLDLRTRYGQRGASLAARVRQHLEDQGDTWDPSWSDRAHRLLALVGELRLAARTAAASQVLATALSRSGLLQLQRARVRSGDPLGRRALDALSELQRVVWAAESATRWLTLGDLLTRLDAMRDEATTAEPSPQSDEDLVTISTIHRAKGLEWSGVVLADCRPYHAKGLASVIWDREARAVVCTRVAGDPTAAFQRWSDSPAKAVDREEHRRLIYVAMTRARDLLLVTTTRGGEEGEFFELAAAAAGPADWAREWLDFGSQVSLPWAAATVSARVGAALGPTTPERRVSIPRLAQRWQEIERLRASTAVGPLRPDQLSFTGIDILNRCPRQYWYRYLARYPAYQGSENSLIDDARVESEGLGGEEARQLGIAVHQVLERLHADQLQRAATPDEASRALEAAATRLTAQQRALAEDMVARYIAGPTAALPTVAIELRFSWRDWAGPGCPTLTGAIDRVAQLPSGQLLIIDYKTNLSLAPEDLASYSRQLQLYSAAVMAGVMGVPVRAPATALAMLRSGDLIEIASGESERRQALSWAVQAARRLELGDYRSVEGFPERPCGNCPFVERCPERRPGIRAGLAGQFEQSL
ncbi:MAG: ATP-dependent DNA helicase [Candidatus Dormiibacterota bacterium]